MAGVGYTNPAVPYSSAQISQMMMAQNSMFGGQAAYAQQLAYPMRAAMNPGMAPPPPPAPPPMGFIGAATSGQTGMFGEQISAQFGATMNQGAHMGVGAAGLGLGAAVGLAGGPVGLALGAATMAPTYAAHKAVDVYGGNFMQGMNQQAALNSTLRSNFSFFGGQGRFGRGFDQGQMGQVGQMMAQELRSNVFTSAGELNQLISGGAEAGMLTGVRDVQQFTQKFRKMIDTLKTVQRELGGSLTEALTFVRQAKGAGVFQEIDRNQFAVGIRGAEAASGLSRDQLMGLATQGAQISRAVGGYGRQGATGALRMASTLGGAVQSGAINEELLSEATGGLTGADALQAMVGQMMQRSARFSRRGMGRFSMFAMANEEGTGLDAGMMDRFLSGDISTSEVRRAAHGNVRRMGRARALNQQGVLRGAMLEQGGLAGQIGMMRLMLGDRVMNQSDDLASLVLQRRFRMSRPQAEVMMSLMRNQGSIAEREAHDRVGAERQQALETDVARNRSVDSFMRHLQHGLEEHTGVMRAREMGRNLMSRVSSLVERAMNDALGIAENQVTERDRSSLNRMAMGTATEEDFQRLGVGQGIAASAARGQRGFDLNRRGLLQLGNTPADTLRSRGIDTTGMGVVTATREIEAAAAARGGTLILERDRAALEELEKDSERTMRRIGRARLLALESGDPSQFYQEFGGNANAIDAYMSRNDIPIDVETDVSIGSMMRMGGGLLNQGGLLGDARSVHSRALRNVGGMGGQIASMVGRGAAAFAMGADIGTVGDMLGLRSMSNLGSRSERAATFLSMGAGRSRDNSFVGRLMSDANPLAMEAAVGNEEFRRALTDVLETESEGEMPLRLSALNQRAAQLGDPAQQREALKLVAEIQSQVRGGRVVTGSVRAAAEAVVNGTSRERQIQLMQERANIGRGFESLSESAEAAGLVTMSTMSTRLSEAYYSNDMPGSEMMDLQMGLISEIAGLDTGGEQYGELARAAGSDSRQRAILRSAANYRQLSRALSGRSRRGLRGRAETAMRQLTGGTLGEMDLTVMRNGREVSIQGRNVAARVERIMRQGGENADRIQAQMTAHLEGLGVEGSGDMLKDYRRAISDSDLDETERHNLIRQTSSNEDLQRVQREALERRQRQQNPLDTTRNDLLRRIASNLEKINIGVQAGMPPGEETNSTPESKPLE